MDSAEAMKNRVAAARSFLFIPGNRPERFEKAVRSGADAVVLDLEDGVPVADKAKARADIESHWSRLLALSVPLIIRTNVPSSAHGEDDIAWLAKLAAPAAVMLPKAESGDAIARVHRELQGLPVMPLIESVAGWSALSRVASSPGVVRLTLGHVDFMADSGIQCGDDEVELAPLRFAIAMATRTQRLASPVDGVTVQFGDLKRLRSDTRRSVRFGFGAKMCIHPSQVPVVHEVLAPSAEELAWAQRVLEADLAAGGGAVQLEGRMIDMPVVLQARRTVARAAASDRQPG